MPSCALTSLSTLLTPDGWIRTDRTPSAGSVFGVDRHGSITLQPVSVQDCNVVTDVCFVGTRAAFGAFHPDSVVMDRAGGLRTVKSIIEADTLASIRFERAFEVDGSSATEAACAQLWSELRAVGIVTNAQET